MQNSAKITTTIIGVVIVFALVAAYFNGERIADPLASDWQTYRSEEYGFEVKYPTDWSANEFNKKAIAFQRLDNQGFGIQIRIYSDISELPNNNAKLGFEEWIDKQIDTGIFRNKKESMFGAKNYRRIEVQDLGIVNFRNSFFTHNSLIYSIHVDENDPSMPVYDQILSTFRFLE